MLELGYADFVSDTFHGALAPTTTPPEVVERLASAMLASMQEPSFHEKLRNLGFEVIGNGPDGMRRRIDQEVPRYRELIAKAGIEKV